jgi:hypothetical protein
MSASWRVKLSVKKSQFDIMRRAAYEGAIRHLEYLGTVLEDPSNILSPESFTTEMDCANSVIKLFERQKVTKAGKINLKLTDDQFRFLNDAIYSIHKRYSELLEKSEKFNTHIPTPTFLLTEIECAKAVSKMLDNECADWPF